MGIEVAIGNGHCSQLRINVTIGDVNYVPFLTDWRKNYDRPSLYLVFTFHHTMLLNVVIRLWMGVEHFKT